MYAIFCYYALISFELAAIRFSYLKANAIGAMIFILFFLGITTWFFAISMGLLTAPFAYTPSTVKPVSGKTERLILGFVEFIKSILASNLVLTAGNALLFSYVFNFDETPIGLQMIQTIACLIVAWKHSRLKYTLMTPQLNVLPTVRPKDNDDIAA